MKHIGVDLYWPGIITRRVTSDTETLVPSGHLLRRIRLEALKVNAY